MYIFVIGSLNIILVYDVCQIKMLCYFYEIRKFSADVMLLPSKVSPKKTNFLSTGTGRIIFCSAHPLEATEVNKFN